MKKNSKILIILVGLVVIVGGAYAIYHKSYKAPASGYTTTSNSSNTSATNSSIIVTKTSSSLGQYLAEPSGHPLYTFGGDSSGVSKCTGTCLTSWPAYVDLGSTTNLPTGVGTIKRTDNGQTQFTYYGMPLYVFVGDTSNQPTGNGVQNFTLAKPATTTTSSTNSSSSNW